MQPWQKDTDTRVVSTHKPPPTISSLPRNVTLQHLLETSSRNIRVDPTLTATIKRHLLVLHHFVALLTQRAVGTKECTNGGLEIRFSYVILLDKRTTHLKDAKRVDQTACWENHRDAKIGTTGEHAAVDAIVPAEFVVHARLFFNGWVAAALTATHRDATSSPTIFMRATVANFIFPWLWRTIVNMLRSMSSWHSRYRLNTCSNDRSSNDRRSYNCCWQLNLKLVTGLYALWHLDLHHAIGSLNLDVVTRI
mmetsp:Transcript_47852/g.79196  ORF Transcript_47852/g.79196 Transcript_47852/m.79196 type:complete len:251 (+) Transcript_47852:118-870(+)